MSQENEKNFKIHLISLCLNSLQGSEASLLATSMLPTGLSNSDVSENEKDLYGILQSMIPQFHNLPHLNMAQSSNV